MEIGERNRIREFTTIHRGTAQGDSLTRIGSDNLLMACTHIAHDCQIGDHMVMSSAASLGGHVQVDDWAILGGFRMVHQFCRIGAHCFTGMGNAIGRDVPPFIMVAGQHAKPRSINSEGLRRRDFSAERITAIKRAFRTLYSAGLPLAAAKAEIAQRAEFSDDLRRISDFLAASERSIVR